MAVVESSEISLGILQVEIEQWTERLDLIITIQLLVDN